MLRQELVQRRIEQADRHRPVAHRLEQMLEVLPLNIEQLGECLLAIGFRRREDHLADFGQMVEEHVLGPAQADPFGSERDGDLGIVRLGVGSDVERAELVRPLHQLSVPAVHFGLFRLLVAGEDVHHLGGGRVDLAVVDLAGEPVDRDPVALFENGLADGDGSLFVVDVEGRATADARLAHLPGDESRVGGRTAESRQDSLGDLHAAQVFGRRFATDEDQLHVVVGVPLLLGIGGMEDDLARRRPRTGVDPLREQTIIFLSLLFRSGIEDRLQQLIQVVRWNPPLLFDGGLRIDQSFVHQVDGDPHGGETGPLGVAGLQHPDVSFLDGELDVLHVFIVLLQRLADVVELLVPFGHVVLERLFDPLGRAGAGHDVFPLGVDEVVAAEAGRTVGAVAGEPDAGRTVVAQVAEDHRLHVGGRPPVVRNAVLPAVDHRPVVHPAAEHGSDAAPELLHRIGREFDAGLFLDDRLELPDDVLDPLDRQILLVIDAGRMQFLFQNVFEEVGVGFASAA